MRLDWKRSAMSSSGVFRLRSEEGLSLLLGLIPSILLLAVIALLAQAQTAETPAEAHPFVLQVRLENEAITPVTAQFLARSIQIAEERRAAALLLVMDTPGGLVDSTREIVKSILASNVPVIVYVAPAGARAASAGVFITLAGHVAAMAPGTNIGAAHPVQIGGLPGSPPSQPEEKSPPSQTEEKKNDKQPAPPTSPQTDKIVNDTVAWARALAELRGRNVDWAERAVTHSLSSPASEAVRDGIVDVMANDIADLLSQIDGREVNLARGSVFLRTGGAEVQLHQMWWGQRILAAISNPNVAFLLLIFGFYGVLFELYSPGWGVAGTLGIICLVLAFFALAVLPINYVGLALIAIALALFVAEVFITSYGFLTIGGLVCLVAGGMMLVDSPAGFMRISLWVLIPVALSTATITIFLVGNIVKAHRTPAQTGGEGLARFRAIAHEDFEKRDERYHGVVRTHGELWRAVTQAPVTAGQELEIEGRDGLTLLVRPGRQISDVESPSQAGRQENDE